MVKNLQNVTLDELDKSLLRALQKDGRLSNVELARKITLSPVVLRVNCNWLDHWRNLFSNCS